MSITQAQGRSDRNAPIFFFFMNTDPAVRLWSGTGDFRVDPDAVDTEGGIYKGMRLTVGMPELTIPLNGTMKRLDFGLVGVPADVMRLANADRETVRGGDVWFGITMLGDNLRPIAAISWLCNGVADTPRVARTGQRGAPQRLVTLSVGAGSVSRRQKRLTRWTGVEQRRISPTDAFCDRVTLYDSVTTERWPR